MAARERHRANDRGNLRSFDGKTDEKGSEDAAPPTNRAKRVTMTLVFGSLLVLIVRQLFFSWEPSFAAVYEHHEKKSIGVPCSKDYVIQSRRFPGCTPKTCGRVVMDDVVTEDEALRLLKIAKAGMAYGGSSGGATILDLHSGALSQKDHFVDVYSIVDNKTKIFSEEDFDIYRHVKKKIQKAISLHFGVRVEKLYLTKPTFFSRMTPKPAKTKHDEYWHPHIDKEEAKKYMKKPDRHEADTEFVEMPHTYKDTYGSFDYTSLLYLANFYYDFNGGRFVFVDKHGNSTVEPKLGRVSFFTSGSENLHYVEPVTRGERFAITVSFTCDPDMAIEDPKFH